MKKRNKRCEICGKHMRQNPLCSYRSKYSQYCTDKKCEMYAKVQEGLK